MLEDEFQTAETKPQPFPWPAVVVLAVMAFLTGVAFTTAALRDRGAGWLRIASGPLALALLTGWAWAGLRRRVRLWQRAYGLAVEYVARRKREHEAGIRFEAP